MGMVSDGVFLSEYRHSDLDVSRSKRDCLVGQLFNSSSCTDLSHVSWPDGLVWTL